MAISQAELFKILGVETRIRIIELLKQKGTLGVNDLAGVLRVSPSAVSQHLKILKHAGLVRNERKGYWIPYSVNEEALEQCQELLSKVCTCGCKGTGQVREAELSASDDKLSLLQKRERELQRQLNEVRCRIKEVEREE